MIRFLKVTGIVIVLLTMISFPMITGCAKQEKPQKTEISQPPQRSQETLYKFISDHSDQVKYCYYTFLQQDSKLEGKTEIEITINPAGEVCNLTFQNSIWNNSLLQPDIEKEMKNVIMKWHFEQVEGGVDVTANATFKFEPGSVRTGMKIALSETKSDKTRSQKAISQVVLANKNTVQYCYWTYKKEDTNLKGKLSVEFTINSRGEVTAVKFSKSDWNDNPLQPKVEKCIKNVIMNWCFDPIDAEAGDVTAGASFIFE
ncbi:MAG: AgmX/PglI C-terminal domain-containing protein [Candidatus Hatepunaea meridiana]|nr:AgmX/PglI C-terminal domain-containing protein [Candidatus Hatepunaea meridiana]